MVQMDNENLFLVSILRQHSQMNHSFQTKNKSEIHQYQDMTMALVDHNHPGQQYPKVLVHKAAMNLKT